MRIPFISLIAGSALALGGCAYGDLGMGLGYGGGYSPYGSYGSPYYGTATATAPVMDRRYAAMVSPTATARLITAGTATIIIRAAATTCTTAIAGPTR